MNIPFGSLFSIPRPSREMLLQSAGDCTLDMLLQMLIKSSQVQLYIPTFVMVIIMAYRVRFQTYYSEPLRKQESGCCANTAQGLWCHQVVIVKHNTKIFNA